MNSVAPLSTTELMEAVPPGRLATLVHSVAWDLENTYVDLLRPPTPDLPAILDLFLSVEAVMTLVRRHATFAAPAQLILDLNDPWVPAAPAPKLNSYDQALLLRDLLIPLRDALLTRRVCVEQFRAALDAHADLATMLLPLKVSKTVTDGLFQIANA